MITNTRCWIVVMKDDNDYCYRTMIEAEDEESLEKEKLRISETVNFSHKWVSQEETTREKAIEWLSKSNKPIS